MFSNVLKITAICCLFAVDANAMLTSVQQASHSAGFNFLNLAMTRNFSQVTNLMNNTLKENSKEQKQNIGLGDNNQKNKLKEVNEIIEKLKIETAKTNDSIDFLKTEIEENTSKLIESETEIAVELIEKTREKDKFHAFGLLTLGFATYFATFAGRLLSDLTMFRVFRD